MKLHPNWFVLLFFVFLINAPATFSQQVVFNYIPRPEQNPWYIITSITQDAHGYMWFGGNGIHRYNGVDVVTYRNDPLNSNSLANNTVESLFAGDSGIIWIGMLGEGLDRFDQVNNTFTHYRHQQHNNASLINDTVTAITKDKEGNLWIGTHGGLDRFDRRTGKFTHYKHNANDTASLSNNNVRSVYVDREDIVWVGTGDPFYNDVGIANKHGGLNRLNKNTNKFTRYLHDEADPNSLADNRVRSICEDSYGTLWIGTAGDGLHSMDRATGKFKRYSYDPSSPEKLSRSPLKKTLSFVDDHITFIKEDAAGFLWIGTMMGGITRYDPQTKKATRYGTGKDMLGGFEDYSGWAAYASHDGTFWISTWEGDLFRIDPFKINLPYVTIGNEVHGLYKEPNGMVWICTQNTLIKTDAKNNVLKKYLIDKNQSSVVQRIINFYRDKSGNFWLLTNDGLITFNPQTEKFTRYIHNPADNKSLIDNEIWSICEDHNMNLWIGTFDGLDKWDRKKDEFTHYRDSIAIRNQVKDVLEDNKNRLWVGTSGGIKLINSETGKFKNYLDGVDIHSIFQDEAGSLWIGASDGFFRFNNALDSFVSFPDPGSGLHYKNVVLVSEDSQKRLWLYTSTGVIRLNKNRDSSNIFEKSYGLKNFIDAGAVLNGFKGEIFLSDAAGYYDINPDQVSGNFIPPQIVFTDFKLGEQSVLPGADSLLPTGISNAQKIRLNYMQNIFSFGFDVLHFNNPAKNPSFFKLENYDVAWRQSGVDRSAFYYNVPPGQYVFRVKAANANGVWAEKNIEVIIDPPWYRTWWAYTIFAVFAFGIIWGIIYYRSRQLRIENRKLEEKVSERTHELQEEKEKVESTLSELKSTQAQLIQSEKMASLGELTAGIAHEIQNPLNFVNNFSEVNREMIDELQTELKSGNVDEAINISNDIKDNEEKINHHGKRADAIVKGMLQHSRQSSGKKEPTDINALCDEYLRLSYHGLRAKDKSFNADFKTDFDESIGKINIVPQDIGRVLLNLINNAFYAVNERKSY